MPVVISLLRAVNVGGHNKIKMDALRALYASLKLREPQTYVQSGNVIFDSPSCEGHFLGSHPEFEAFGARAGVERRYRGARPYGT